MSAGVATGTSLAELVAEHCRRFAWYHDLIDGAGATPAGRGAAGTRHGDQPSLLARLPLLDQAALEAHYYDAAALPGAATYLTSGTSGGARKRIQYSHADDDRYVAQRHALFARFLEPVRPGAIAVSDLGTGHAAALAHRIFTELGLDARDISFQAPVDEHIARLNAWAPDVLFTMPMILDQILQAPRRLTARPRKLIVVGDLVTPSWRRHVATRLGIADEDILDVVGSIEVGAIAYYDVPAGRYVFHDHLIAEVAEPEAPQFQDAQFQDAQFQDAQARCRDHGDGILVLTSFARDYFPAVRYVTGDLVSGLRRTELDGRTVTTCERFLGRVTGDLKHGERISSYDLAEAMAQVFPGHPFEVGEGRTMCIRVVADLVTDGQRQAVRQLIRAAAPDVATMLDAGLVGDIDVVAVPLGTLRSGRAKRRFNVAVG